eukprot:CAMPEP_0178668374 /NCGR_PEP_ID=MMETSP0698-20121128/31547_1 /TAXON_ID=265572 /ORGANISM="Extubocellulus spinifer, Strain CCMP396" /LENGTH=42 /DNA_ID= /DNA_START= /DNA_END= /DNA_ORIENTATION=
MQQPDDAEDMVFYHYLALVGTGMNWLHAVVVTAFTVAVVAAE